VAARNIFICYRRDDSAGDAGRLFDRLNERFPGRVFMDVAGISLATRWAEAIEKSIRDCAVIIVIIGKRWLDGGPDGTRRIDNGDDPIRREIVTAMRLGIALVPLAVSGAAIPDRKLLPAELAALVDWQAHRIDHDDFDHDSARLIRQLEQVLGEPTQDAEPRNGMIGQLAGASGGRATKAAWFGLTLGSLKLWVTVGMAAMAFVAVGVGGLMQTGQSQPPTPTVSEPAAAGRVPDAAPPTAGPGTSRPPVTVEASPRADPPKRPQRPGAAATTPRPEATTGRGSATGAPPDVSDSLAGDYALTAYAYNGLPVDLNGTLSLVRAGNGERGYRFRMLLVDGVGTRLTYTGTMQREGAGWLATVANSNDPSAVYTPIATEIAVDGHRIRVRNTLGQDAVWQRR
jgi:hypothetical protein